MKPSSAERVCIVGGCGHVGLPLGLSLAARGVQVELLDKNRDVVQLVNSGTMPFQDEGADQLLASLIGQRVTATDDFGAVARADVIIVSIGTPVDEHLNPRVQDLQDLLDQLRPYMRDGHLLILRSTIFPGTTQLVHDRLREFHVQVDLAFCPERVAQGYALKEIAELPQIVAAFTDEEFGRAAYLFQLIAPEVIRLEPLEAELAKLFTNAWRYIQFAIANQFYMMAEGYGLDFYKIYQALTYHYPRAQSCVKPGLAAGPCLFKDTMQLSAFHSNSFFLGHAAMLVNEGLPDFLVRRLKGRVQLRHRAIGILGMAFKAESDDRRNSLSYKLAKILRSEGAIVLCTDPYVQDRSLYLLDEVLARAETIIIACPHQEYGKLDLRGRDVVDPWGAFWGRT
jgi:UDP-N-acetyl-D-mannosaminuronic acid dehydrogenase